MPEKLNAEQTRLVDARNQNQAWKKWGPYLSERQWGTVREDYSDNGAAWDYFSHDQARSRAYRWGEDGLAGVLHYSTDPLVSRDIIGDPASCVFDSGLTQAAGSLVKVFGWYDNEWGYTCRLTDLAAIVGAQL